MTTEFEASSLVIDAMQLVAQQEIVVALDLLNTSEIPTAALRHAALSVMAVVMSGVGASARFAELRQATHDVALLHGAQDRQAVLNLETIAAAQAFEQGDSGRADAIIAGSVFTPIDHAWCAVALTGQAVHGWLGDHSAEIWHGQRRHYGIGGAS